MTRDRNYGTNSLPSRKNSLRQASHKKAQNISVRDDISDWSENILAEFNDIIAKEINELTRAKLNSQRNQPLKEEKISYKDLLNEFGITDSSSTNSLDDIKTETIERKLPPSLLKRIQNDTDRHLLQKHRLSGSLPENLHYDLTRGHFRENNNCTQEKMNQKLSRNSSSLLEFYSRGNGPKNGKLPQEKRNSYENGKENQNGYEKENENEKANQGPWCGFKMRYLENLNTKLPPRQKQEVRKKTSQSKINHKRRKFSQTVSRSTYENSDCDDISARSKLFVEYSPRSAPSTPTEEKNLTFSRFLKKRHTPVFHDNNNEAILVRVSSLPDQNLLHLSNEQLLMNATKRCGNEKETTTVLRKRDLSPLNFFRSNLTGKRLSESNKDIGRTSPVNLMKFPFRRSKSNDVAVECHLPNVNNTREEMGNKKHVKAVNEMERKIIDYEGSKSVSVNTF